MKGTPSNANDTPLDARIQAVCEGQHPYAVAVAEGIEGTITFSLTPDIWEEESMPHAGDHVSLKDIKRTENGWRSMRAHFIRPQQPKKKGSR